MNQAHYHLLLNHVPIIGTVFGIAVLLAGFVFKSAPVKRTALGIFVLAAIFAIPAYLTGEGAEDLVKKLPGVIDPLLDRHEKLGETFLWLVGALGVTSWITFMADLTTIKFTQLLYIITLVASIAAIVVANPLGTSGGEIRHTEIRTDNTPTTTPAGEQNNGGEGKEDND